MVKTSSPFGSQTRTRILLALRLLDEGYPRELARVLGLRVNGVQMAVRGLSRDNLIATRQAGRTQLIRLNPRYFAREDLQRYLLTLAAPDRDLRARLATLRRRPRRPGKPR